jgi:hypothetical protein
MNITLTSTKLTARLNSLDKGLQKQIDNALEITASEAARNIADRGKRGGGYLGKFAPYSPDYAKVRRAKGRQVSYVDLTDTGQMWAGLSATLERRGVAKIYFLNADANRKAYFNNKKRPFFGFNAKDKKALIKFFTSKIKI